MKKMSVILAIFVVLILIFAACGPIHFMYVAIDIGHISGVNLTGLRNTLSGLGYQIKEINLEEEGISALTEDAVILPAPTLTFRSGAISNLNAYLRAGGTVIMLASSYNNSGNTLNNLASNLTGYIPVNFAETYFTNHDLIFNTSSPYSDDFIFTSQEILVKTPVSLGTALVDNNIIGYFDRLYPKSDHKDGAGDFKVVFKGIKNVNSYGKIIAFGSLETFEYASYPTNELLEKMIKW